jgi:hypothetical protein
MANRHICGRASAPRGRPVPDPGGAGVPAVTTGVESPIRADLVNIAENLLMLGEEMGE